MMRRGYRKIEASVLCVLLFVSAWLVCKNARASISRDEFKGAVIYEGSHAELNEEDKDDLSNCFFDAENGIFFYEVLSDQSDDYRNSWNFAISVDRNNKNYSLSGTNSAPTNIQLIGKGDEKSTKIEQIYSVILSAYNRYNDLLSEYVETNQEGNETPCQDLWKCNSGKPYLGIFIGAVCDQNGIDFTDQAAYVWNYNCIGIGTEVFNNGFDQNGVITDELVHTIYHEFSHIVSYGIWNKYGYESEGMQTQTDNVYLPVEMQAIAEGIADTMAFLFIEEDKGRTVDWILNEYLSYKDGQYEEMYRDCTRNIYYHYLPLTLKDKYSDINAIENELPYPWDGENLFFLDLNWSNEHQIGIVISRAFNYMSSQGIPSVDLQKLLINVSFMKVSQDIENKKISKSYMESFAENVISAAKEKCQSIIEKAQKENNPEEGKKAKRYYQIIEEAFCNTGVFYHIEGKVISSDGEPVIKAKINITGDGAEKYTGETNTHGMFFIIPHNQNGMPMRVEKTYSIRISSKEGLTEKPEDPQESYTISSIDRMDVDYEVASEGNAIYPKPWICILDSQKGKVHIKASLPEKAENVHMSVVKYDRDSNGRIVPESETLVTMLIVQNDFTVFLPKGEYAFKLSSIYTWDDVTPQDHFFYVNDEKTTEVELKIKIKEESTDSPEITPTPMITPTPEVTPSITPTPEVTPSITPTPEITPGVTPSVSEEDDFTIEDGVLTKYTGNAEEVVVPEGVTSIGEFAFHNNGIVKRVVLPKGVETIGREAFSNCGNLESISIPKTVKEIGEYAFYSDEKLTDIVLPNILETIENSTFEMCSSLQVFSIPKSVTKIGGSAFKDCTSLQHISFSENLQTIGDYAFQHSGLVEVTIPRTIQSMGSGAFASCERLNDICISSVIRNGSSVFSCSNIESITFSDDVTEIPSGMFAGWSSLKYVEIPASVVSIGSGAFSGCTNIEELNLEYGIERIENAAFEKNTHLVEVVFPSSVKYIGKGAFDGCSSLSEVMVLGDNITIDEYGFYQCTNLKNLVFYKDVQYIGNACFCGCNSLEMVSFLKSVKYIGDGAFYESSGLKEIVLPNGLEHLGTGSFNKCHSLEKVVICSDVDYLGEGIFANCEKLSDVELPNGFKKISAGMFAGDTGIEQLIIPDGVEKINSVAFLNNESLCWLYIPSSVSSIEDDRVFEGCMNLVCCVEKGSYAEQYCIEHDIKYSYSTVASESFSIENGVLIKYTGIDSKVDIPYGVIAIGDEAFMSCEYLTDIVIPNTVKSIGYKAFSNCSLLNNLVLPNSVTSIGEEMCYHCCCLQSVSLSSSLTVLPRQVFAYCSELNNVVLPNGLTTIEMNAFEGCTNLKTISFPESLTEIGNNAFSSCGFSEIAIPETVTKLGHNVFDVCKNLKSICVSSNVLSAGDVFSACCYIEEVSFTDKVEIIPERMFYNWNWLKSVTIPSSVVSIGTAAFDDCYRLERLIINPGVEEIGESAFMFCFGLKEVIIPNTVVNIGSNAFAGCHALTNLMVLSETVSIGASAFSDCSELVNAEFQGNIVSLGRNAFSCCEKLSAIYLQGNFESIQDETFIACTSLREVTFPKSVKKIGEEAFANCKSLSRFSIPNTVTEIEGSAFYGCSALSRLAIPNSVSVIDASAFGEDYSLHCYVEVGSYAEEFCIANRIEYGYLDNGFAITRDGVWVDYFGNEKNLIVPNTVIEVSSRAFSGRGDIVSIVFPESLVCVGNQAFEFCTNLENISFNDGVKNIYWQAFNGCSSLKSVYIPESVIKIGDMAFMNCKALERVDLGAGVQIIGNHAFRNCSSLEELVVPNSVNYLYDYSFAECTKLKSVTVLGEELIYISDYAFCGCTDLISLTIGEGKYGFVIYQGAFSGCSSLKDILLPKKTTGRILSSFHDCTSLRKVVIPEGIRLEGSAFYGCSNLEEVYIPSNVDFSPCEHFYGCSENLTLYIYPNSSICDYISWMDDNNIKYEYVDYSLSGADVTLSDSVSLTMYYNLNSSAIWYGNIKAHVTYPDGHTEILSYQGQRKENEIGKYYYGFQINLSPKQINDAISIQLFCGDKPCSAKDTYSVREYCETLTAEENTEKYDKFTRDTAEKLIVYGEYSKAYFDQRAGKVVENVVEEISEKASVLEKLETVSTMSLDGNMPDGVYLYGFTLSLDSTIGYTAYFDVKDDATAELYQLKRDEENGLYYLKGESVPIGELGKVMEFQVGTATIQSSPLTYIDLVLHSDVSQSLTSLCIALWDYYEAVQRVANAVNSAG